MCTSLGAWKGSTNGKVRRVKGCGGLKRAIPGQRKHRATEKQLSESCCRGGSIRGMVLFLVGETYTVELELL